MDYGENVNYVNYEAVENAKNGYLMEANQILDLVKRIKSINSDLKGGFSNKTARAFVERIDTDHIPKLNAASEALQEVSNWLQDYENKHRDDDGASASAITAG